ncbi:MAG TPA: hypothetical protein VGB77_08960 [Abditibacteriaceae bacterium]
MMSLVYLLNHPLKHTRQRLISPALLLPVCLSATLLGATAAYAQTTILAPPNYSDLDEGNGQTNNLYDTLPRLSNSAQNNTANNSLETQRFDVSGAQAQQPLQQSLQPPQEKNIRNLIRSLGVQSRDVQDMVITHIVSEMQFREPMRNASSRLFQAMSRPGVTDAQLGVLLNDCRVAYETDKLRRLDTLDVLKAKIGPFLTPRTESMLFLLGLEGDVIITLPTPALLAQSQREQQRLSRVVEGLKLEADSLRRERDDLKAEFQAYQVANQVANAAKAPVNVVASAQINPHGSTRGFYAPPSKRSEENLTDDQKEIIRLTKENADLQKDVKRLRREKTTLLRSFRKATAADGKRDTEKREAEKEGKTKADKR